MKLNRGRNLRIFKNDFLEFFTYVHPLVPALMWAPIAIFSFVYAITAQEVTFAYALAYMSLGLFVWSFVEYFLHRVVFHFKATTPFQQKIAYLIHGIHHEDPEDQRRLLMPPVVSIVLAVIFYSSFYWILGPMNCNPFFSGFVVGYLCYDYMHFASHFMKPKSKILLTLKQNHMRHHYVSPEKLYGVSNPLWDFIFKTK